MYKYISLFIGIIIYLIYNHNETFNVGGKNIDESCENNQECNSDGGNCNDTCYCYFNKCKSIDSIGPDSDYNVVNSNVCSAGENDKIDVNMFSNSGGLFGRCSRDTDCQSPNWLSSATIYTKDIEYNLCIGEGDFGNPCQQSHKANLCIQQCKLNTKNNNSKDLVNAGFEHINLIDINDDIDNDIYNNDIPDLINILNDQTISRFGNITLTEYYFFKFLEKKYNSRCKKIKDSIVYINSRIFYYFYREPFVSSRIGGLENYTRNIDRYVSPFNQIILQNVRYNRPPLYRLHIDYNDFKKWRGDNTDIDNNRITDWGIRPAFSNITGTKFEMENNYSNNMALNYLFRTNNITNINIWVKLDGSTNYNSLGLIDIIDDTKLNDENFNLLKNKTLNDLSSDNNNIKDTRVNQFSMGSGVNININNYRETDEYNANPSNLYTYNMKNGDALVFKTLETPHTSITLQPNEWRITNENRYSYTSKPFNINDVFDESGDSIKSNDNINNSKLSMDEEFNDVTKGDGFFSIDIVKQFFIDQYNRLKILYDVAYSQLDSNIHPLFVTFNKEIFKFLMDNIRFEILQLHSEDRIDTTVNNRLIIDNIKELISYKNIDEECNPDIEPDECVEGYSCQSASQDPEVELYTCQIEY